MLLALPKFRALYSRMYCLPQSFVNEFSSNATESHFPHDKIQQRHIKTTPFQRVLLAAGSGVMSLLDPGRDVFGETTAFYALRRLYKIMQNDPNGKRILQDRPRINSRTVNIDELRSLEDDTLGKCYAQFLDKYNYSPDHRREVLFISEHSDPPNHWYIMQRYREIHDLYHVLLGQGTDMLGEVVVKWVEASQTRLPLAITGAPFGALRLRPKQRERYIKTYLPYALRVSRSAQNIMCFYFEENWERSIKSIREELCIESPPVRK